MTTALLVLAVAAGMACPAHMWWTMRRGERAACRVPDPVRREDAEGLRRRRRELEARIAQAGDMQASERAGVIGRG